MDPATCEAETAFADMITADPEWLRDEFDALVAASFGQPPAAPPPAPPQGPPDDGRRPPSRWHCDPLQGAVTPAHAATGHRRERSPPP